MTSLSEIDLDAIRLDKGAHQPGENQFCVMELASYLAREPFSDHPACVSPTIAAFLRSWNDSLNDGERQMLKPYAVAVIGTATNEADELRRAWMATDWLVREFAPAWLDLAGLSGHTTTLRNLPELDTDAKASAAIAIIRAAESAAGSAARSAAWSAAESAARSAAWSAAGLAAESAARSAAGSAAWSAARSAAWSAARSAAWSAAESAARSALQPTVTTLQASALELLERLIAVGRTETAVQS